MDADVFRQALSDLGLSQIKAAAFLDIDTRTVRRWATGDAHIPRSVVMLLEIMKRCDLRAEDFS